MNRINKFLRTLKMLRNLSLRMLGIIDLGFVFLCKTDVFYPRTFGVPKTHSNVGVIGTNCPQIVLA